jgi:protein tyrosine phosphatase (PTP) superfamily phosphohydrolase (DUF442 family)
MQLLMWITGCVATVGALVFGARMMLADSGNVPAPATSAGGTDTEVVTTAPTTTPGLALAVPTTLPGVGNFAKVSDVLYRGEQPTAEGMKELKKLGIKTVVNLRDFHSDRDEIKGTGLQYVHIRCAAWHPEEQDVVAFLKVLNDPANQPVFVHCWQGSDRTGMMVLSYRVTEQGWSVDDAIKELPNFGFHPVWKSIRAYVGKFDAARVKKKVTEAKTVAVEMVE